MSNQYDDSRSAHSQRFQRENNEHYNRSQSRQDFRDRSDPRQLSRATERWNPGMQSDSGPQDWRRGDPDFGIGSEYGPDYAFRDFRRADQIRDRWVRDFERDDPERQQRNWTEEPSRTFMLGRADRGPYTGVAPKGYRRSDERIREDICERLTDNGAVDPSDVLVDVRGGEVTLTGFVQNRDMKRLAEDISADVSGVSDVHNQLRIRRQSQPAEEERAA